MTESVRMIPLLIDPMGAVFLSNVVGLDLIAPVLIAPVLSALFDLLLQYAQSMAPIPLPLVSRILLLVLFLRLLVISLISLLVRLRSCCCFHILI